MFSFPKHQVLRFRGFHVNFPLYPKNLPIEGTDVLGNPIPSQKNGNVGLVMPLLGHTNGFLAVGCKLSAAKKLKHFQQDTWEFST